MPDRPAASFGPQGTDELRLVRLDRGHRQPDGLPLARDRGAVARGAGLRAVRLHRSVDVGGGGLRPAGCAT